MGWNHQPVGVLYIHYKDSELKVGWVYPQYKEWIDPGTLEQWKKDKLGI